MSSSEIREKLQALAYENLSSEEVNESIDKLMSLANTFFDDVTDFLHQHEVSINTKPRLPQHDLVEFGFKHLYEELNEIENAILEGDLIGIADGIADLVYVALNFAARSGLPFNEIWKAVHYANTHGKRKVKDASESKRGYAEDVIKTPSFTPPEGFIKKALLDAGWQP